MEEDLSTSHQFEKKHGGAGLDIKIRNVTIIIMDNKNIIHV